MQIDNLLKLIFIKETEHPQQYVPELRLFIFYTSFAGMRNWFSANGNSDICNDIHRPFKIINLEISLSWSYWISRLPPAAWHTQASQMI